MKKLILFVVVLELACLCLVGGTALAATIYVPSDQPTIQAGIDAADTGDTVLVADGIHIGSGNKDLNFLGKAITVKSENGPEHCIIDCEGGGRGFYFHNGEGQDSILSGFTITNGYPDQQGGGISCESSSSPTIINCIITDNTTLASGGGTACSSSHPIIINCIISGNLSGWRGGGMFNESSSPTVTNCTITGNWAYEGGGMDNESSSPAITNSIVWGNVAQEYEEIHDDAFSSPTITHSDIRGGYTGNGNIDAIPLFKDSENGDLRLRMGSPCIDAGDNDVASLPATDFEGDPRVVDGDNDSTETVDMGADEHVPAPDIDVSPLAHDFGDVPVGNSSDPADITISNHGDADLIVSDISLSDDTNYSLTGDTTAILAHGESHTVAVTFSPTSAGVSDATLTITSNAPENPAVDVALIGNGVEPDISVSPPSHDFGSVVRGDMSTQGFTMTNTGELDLEIGDASMVGTDASEFEIQADNCSGKTMAPAETCTVDVAFKPTSEGPKSANLSIPSNDPDTPTRDVPVSGEGVAPIPPVIDKIRRRPLEPSQIMRIIGYRFGDEQGDSVVHIGPKTFDSTSPKIKLWTYTKIKVQLPNYKCEWFKGNDYRRRKIWVMVGGEDGVSSNVKKIKVFKPDSCP